MTSFKEWLEIIFEAFVGTAATIFVVATVILSGAFIVSMFL